MDTVDLVIKSATIFHNELRQIQMDDTDIILIKRIGGL